ncbi:MAG: hypothetical protein Q9163_001405 [Psora crenata]
MGNRFRDLPGYHGLIRAHGTIAAITFLFVVPSAILTVRFHRRNPRTAVRIHIWLQILTVLLTTAVIILGFSAVGPARKLSNPHHGIGLAIYILILSQFILGWWMHRKERKKKQIYEPLKVTLHHWLGRAIALLGLAQVPLGLTLYGSPKYLFALYTAVAFGLLVVYFWLTRVQERRNVSDYDSRDSYGTGSVVEERRRRSGSGTLLKGALAGAGLYAVVNKFRRRSGSRSGGAITGPEVVGSRRHSGSYMDDEKYSQYGHNSDRVGRWEDRLLRIAAPIGATGLVTRYFDSRYRDPDSDTSQYGPPPGGAIHDDRTTVNNPPPPAPPIPAGQGMPPGTGQFAPGPYGPPVPPGGRVPPGQPLPSGQPPYNRPPSRGSSLSYTDYPSASGEARRGHGLRDGLATLGVLGLAKSIFNRRNDRKNDRRLQEERDARTHGQRYTGDGLPPRRPHRPTSNISSETAPTGRHPSNAQGITPVPAGIYPGGVPVVGSAGAAEAERERQKRRQEELPLGGVPRPVDMPAIPPDPQGFLHPESSGSESYNSPGGRDYHRNHASRGPAAAGLAAGEASASRQERQERHQSASAGEDSAGTPPVSVRVKMHKDGRHVTLSRLPQAEAEARRMRSAKNKSDSASTLSGDGSGSRFRRRDAQERQNAEAMRVESENLAAARSQAQNPNASADLPPPPPIPESSAGLRPPIPTSVGSPGTYDGMTTDASADYANNRRRRRAERAREKEVEKAKREGRTVKTYGEIDEAGDILKTVAQDWRELIAGSEGFLTGKGRAGCEGKEIAWGDMVSLVMDNSSGKAHRGCRVEFLIIDGLRASYAGRYGHVNNVMYVRYAESGRINWAQNFAHHAKAKYKKDWSELWTPRGHGLILKGIKVDFKFPMTWPDRISVYHKLRSAATPSTDSFVLDVLILSEKHQRPAATCVEDIVVYDYLNGNRSPLRDFMVDQFRETFSRQQAARHRNTVRITKLFQRVEQLEKGSWDSEDAVEDMGRPGNHHNNRHENGIVAPGKRISKQKSNSHINGSADGAPSTNGVPIPSPPAPRPTPLVPEKRINGQDTGSRDGVYVPAEEDDKILEHAGSETGDLSSSDRNSHATVHLQNTRSDMNTRKTSAIRKDHVFRLPLTILFSCPPGDTLTILIILLSLPSTVLTLINTLFAMLTFMPPAGSFFSIPNTFNDMFQGSGGTPSLATIVITDIMGLLIWLVAWTPLQALTIEYTQAVVAATLGGGNTTKKTSYDSTLLCIGIVTIRHVSGRGWIPGRIFGFDWSAILSRIPYISHRPPSLVYVSNDSLLTTDAKGGWGWFRVLVALHILIQGLVHVARRWLQKREYFQTAPIGKKTDPEACAGTLVRSSSNALVEGVVPSNGTATSAITAKASLAVVKDTRDKLSSGKKRRKQANLVRSQQPLWAAFAATKVTIMREYEQNHSLADIAVPDARDPSDLGNASFSDVGDRVWISEVHPNSFVFRTTCFSVLVHTGVCSKFEAGAGFDRSKPFYVRINDTDWTSTKIERCGDDEGTGGLWTGTVFGLTPSSSYRCSVVQSEDDVVVFIATVTTSVSLVDVNEPLAPSNNLSCRGQPPHSPTSPTTTLKKSISTFEASLTESNARQKRSKKDTKTASAMIKKDIEVFNGKISKLGSEDKAHMNRHLQWNQHTRQAEEALSFITDEIESLGSIPEEELKTSQDKKAAWDKTRRQQLATREQLFRGKEAAHREKSVVQSEAAAAQQKRDRLLARRVKLNDQRERLQSAAAQGLSNKERKTSEQVTKDIERMQAEQQLQDQISNYKQALQESRLLFNHYMHQAQSVENAFQEQQILARAPRSEERPLTPEGDLPGENPRNAIAPSFRFPAFGTADSIAGLRSHSGSIRHIDSRPRSTSLLSGNSYYTDFEDIDPALPMPPRAVEAIRERGRKRSGGSAGGSSGSNSQRDPTSPLVGSRLQDSPVGKRSPVWNQ